MQRPAPTSAYAVVTMYGLMISSHRRPALLGHLGADRRVVPAVDALVLLQLHRQVLPHDVLHRVLRLVRELVARRVLVRGLEVVRLPAELRDALVRLGDAAAAGGGAHGVSSLRLGESAGIVGVRARTYRLTDVVSITRISRDVTHPRRRRSPESAEREILEAAESFLRERPFRDLTVDEVMARTTLSRPSFYVYFRDRHHLAVRLVEGIGEALFEMAEPLAGGDAATRARTSASRSRASPTVYAEHGLRAGRDRGRGRPRPGGRARLPRPDRALRGRDRDAHRARHRAPGRVAPLDAARTARALVWMSERYLLMTLGRLPQAPVDTVVDTLVTIWVRTLYTPAT